MDLRQKVPFVMSYASGYLDTFTGTDIITLPKAKANSLQYVKLFGGTEQSGTPTPYAPIDIVCNNGVLKWDSTNQTIYADGTQEKVEVDTTGDYALAEMLLKVGNYQDKQEVISGNVIRNVGVKMLDGTENWTIQDGNYPYFRVDYTQDFSESTYVKGGKCTHFPEKYISPTSNQQGFYMNMDSVTQKTFIALRFNNLFTATSENINNLKSWLASQYAAGTPIIIIFPLKNSTTETVTPQPLTIQAGTNIIEITEASMDDLTLEATYRRSK